MTTFKELSVILQQKKAADHEEKLFCVQTLERENVLILLRISAESLLDSLRKSPIGEKISAICGGGLLRSQGKVAELTRRY